MWLEPLWTMLLFNLLMLFFTLAWTWIRVICSWFTNSFWYLASECISWATFLSFLTWDLRPMISLSRSACIGSILNCISSEVPTCRVLSPSLDLKGAAPPLVAISCNQDEIEERRNPNIKQTVRNFAKIRWIRAQISVFSITPGKNAELLRYLPWRNLQPRRSDEEGIRVLAVAIKYPTKINEQLPEDEDPHDISSRLCSL